MSDREDMLKNALAENGDFDPDKADLLKKEFSADFVGKLRAAERLVWFYMLACVVIAVPVLNLLEESYDTKTLIICTVGLLVIYETTVLLKLWFATAGTKLAVLKEMKQLRLEVADLAREAGVSPAPNVLAPKYEPLKGVSKRERGIWFGLLAVTAVVASTLTAKGLASQTMGTRRVADTSTITLSADGEATSVTTVFQTLAFFSSPKNLPFYAPKSWKAHWFDTEGRELPCTTEPYDETHVRHNVSLAGTVDRGKSVYTRLFEMPGAADEKEGVWTYKNDTLYSAKENTLCTTIILPENAEIVSLRPTPALQFRTGRSLAVRFTGVRGKNERFEYQVQYRLSDKSADK